MRSDASIRSAPLAALLLSAFLSGCGSGGGGRPDLLLVTIETLRPDFIGCYGYDGDYDDNHHQTPNLDTLALEGRVYRRHYTTSVWTAPAHASLLTGLHVAKHGLEYDGQPLASDLPVLAEALRAAGYETAAVVSNASVDEAAGFARGFDSFEGRRKAKASATIDSALTLLANRSEKPLFLWVHLEDPNFPYTAPDDVPRMDFREIVNALSVKTQLRSSAARLASSYAAEIRYADRELGRLLQAWDKAAPGSDVVAVTSDHGEGLLEHSYTRHGLLLFEEQVHIPLILRSKSYSAGDEVEDVTSAVNLAATLLDLCGVSGHGLGGASILGEEGRPGLSFFERPVAKDLTVPKLLETLGCGTVKQIGVVDERFKAILSEEVGYQLYELPDDPDERIDVSEWRSERAAELRAELEAWRDGD